MNNIVNGLEISERILDELKQGIKGCIIRPSVAVIQIGSDEVSNKYIKAKEDACNKIGIFFRYYQYEDGTPELTIINKIKELNNDDYVNGVMIQLPIPEKYNEKRLFNTIINSKDIDGLTDINIGRLISGRKTIVPCTVLAIMKIFEEYNISLSGKDITIIGKGKLVGRPLINVLLKEGATVTVCHSRTENLEKHTKGADIIISATGVKNLLTADMVKDGAIIIDTGCTLEDGKVYGDADFDSLKKKASLITPAIGGVGPITVAMCMSNVIMCYNNSKK